MATTIYLRPGQTSATNISVTDPTVEPGSSVPNAGWMVADTATRRIVRPVLLDGIVAPVIVFTGTGLGWRDESPPTPPRRQRVASQADSTAWTPLLPTPPPPPWGWLVDDPQVVPRPRPRRLDELSSVPAQHLGIHHGWQDPNTPAPPRAPRRRLDEIAAPIGPMVPPPPPLPPWWMASEQPQAPKARRVYRSGDTVWAVVFPVPIPGWMSADDPQRHRVRVQQLDNDAAWVTMPHRPTLGIDPNFIIRYPVPARTISYPSA